MKKIWFVIFICLAFIPAFAQKAPEKLDSVCQLLVKYFNEKDPQKIYELTGEDFQKQISIAKFQQICENNLFPLGDFEEISYEKTSGGVTKYKATFTAGTFGFFASLDAKDKLVTFLFKEYIDETAKRTGPIATDNPKKSTIDLKVDELVQPYITLANTAGVSVGILKDGKTYFYNYGETTKGGKLASEHTLYEIGSITKTFTSTLLAFAVQEKKLKLSDPLSKYLPGSAPLEFEGTVITLEMLANHSSALPRMPDNFDEDTDLTNPYKNYSEQQLIDFYKTVKLERKPGSRYEYSNLAMATLGYILEKIYKKPFEHLVLEKICRPLKMDETREKLLAKDSINFARGHNEKGEATSAWDFQVFAAAGALRSTASDLLKYAKANWGEGPQSLVKAMQLTHKPSLDTGEVKVGLGWHLIQPEKDTVLLHTGGTGGYRSFLAINKEKKFAVVILANSVVGADNVGRSLMAWLENK